MSSDEIKRLVARIKSADHDLNKKFLISALDSSDVLTQASEDFDDVPIIDSRERHELVDIIMWALKRNTISASQIMSHFSMGNRANGIIDKLFEMGLVSDKDANKPRAVIPQSIEDVPTKTIELLIKHGIAADGIVAVLKQRTAT